MISNAPFRVTEYTNGEKPDGVHYVSGSMSLRDASRFAAALSYAQGVFCAVSSDADTYRELWQAGAIAQITQREVQS